MRALSRSGLGRIAAIRDRLDAAAGSAAFAYASIAALQARALWGIAGHRDLSGGDSANYFTDVSLWASELEVDPLYSPLYTVYWGSLKWLIGDTYALTIAHRVLIVFAASLLVLALLRALLSPAVAWVLAAWWALAAVNYDTANEVHLFGLLPLLVAGLIAVRLEGRRGRAAVFGILLTTALLVRNEVVIAAALWLALWAAYEWREARAAEGPLLTERARRSLVPLAVATGVALLAWGPVVARDPWDSSFSRLLDRATYKQDYALCQHYAVGVETRAGSASGQGWTECERFMAADFGSETPSFAEASRSNPGAIADHIRWNLELAPYGLQLALFDRSSGPADRNADYVPVTTGSKLALVLSLALLAFGVAGLVLLVRQREEWSAAWLRERGWGWALLGVVAAVGAWVILTTHPRPAYYFGLTVGVMAVIGLCAMAFARRWPGLSALRAGLPLAFAAMLVAWPSHYREGYSTPQVGEGRHLAEISSRLAPYRDSLRGADTTLLAAGRDATSACHYVGEGDPCVGSALALGSLPPGSADEGLRAEGVDFIYADEAALADPASAAAVEEARRRGWRSLGPAGSGWALLQAPYGGPRD